MITAPSDRRPTSLERDDNTATAAGPGALQGEAWLTLQTRHAQRLVRGRAAAPDKPAIIGLFGFADRLRGIWQGARQDDPYADWWLIQIHTALAAVKQRIQAGQQTLAERLAASQTLAVTVAVSQKPYRTPLRFANPYAYRGARWLGEYDNLARGVLSAVHVGLMDAADADPIGSETVFRDGRRVGQISSGGYGHFVKKCLAFAYVTPDCAEPGTDLEVMILGERRPARVLGEPVYDPESERPRSDA